VIMPIYCYKCQRCGDTYEDIQVKMVGTREIHCPRCYPANGDIMHRDYIAEKPGVITDWEPGYNIGIDEHYTSKADLMEKIRRKGFYPKMHGGTSLARSKSGLYGDEEFRKVTDYSEPEPDIS